VEALISRNFPLEPMRLNTWILMAKRTLLETSCFRKSNVATKELLVTWSDRADRFGVRVDQ
jgi:hypothetical protein